MVVRKPPPILEVTDLKMSHESYLEHLYSNKMLVCRKKPKPKELTIADTDENGYRAENCWVTCHERIYCGSCDFQYASKRLISEYLILVTPQSLTQILFCSC